jgi:hypothetical protein
MSNASNEVNNLGLNPLINQAITLINLTRIIFNNNYSIEANDKVQVNITKIDEVFLEIKSRFAVKTIGLTELCDKYLSLIAHNRIQELYEHMKTLSNEYDRWRYSKAGSNA